MKTDTQIKQDVLDELTWQPDVDQTQIGVIVEDGIVTLTGLVDEFRKKIMVEKAVKNVAGVKAVAEDIEVKYGDEYKKSDKEIARAAVSALEWNASVPKEKVMVKVDNGYVVLTGELPWQYQKKAAKRTVQNLLGVKGVTNAIRVKQKVKSKDVKQQIRKAYERSANLEAAKINVEVEDHTVKLTGIVSSIKEKEDAERAAFLAPGVSEVKNELKVDFYSRYAY